MKSFSMRSFTTFLSRNRLYTAVNVFGLSVSLAFVILIGDLVRRQLTVDGFQANADRIYLMGSEVTMGSAYRLSDRLLSRYPEIESITAAGGGLRRLPSGGCTALRAAKRSGGWYAVSCCSWERLSCWRFRWLGTFSNNGCATIPSECHFRR